jgi:hypothetical protein
VGEVRRVLRGGGSLALLWNRWDLDDPLLARLDALLEQLRGLPTPREAWRRELEASPLFGPLELRRFRYAETVERERAVERVATISVVAALPDEERAAFLERVRGLCPEPTPMPGFTEAFVAGAA